MKIGNYIQQGDVLMTPIDSIPAGCKPEKAKSRGFVLAEGEVTGHAHVLPATAKCQLFSDKAGTLFLNLIAPCTVVHEEHKHVTLPAGNYQIGKVVEVDPFKEEVREVQD